MSRIDQIIGALPDAVVVLDEDDLIVDWLASAERIFGWPAGEAIGKNISMLLGIPVAAGKESSKPFKDLQIKALNLSEVLVRSKEGAEVWICVVPGEPAVLAPAGNQRVIVLRDVTRQKRIDKAKVEVISSVAHELRSPLTSIKGFASTLVNRWDQFEDDVKKRLLGTINNDADRVNRLIAELLDVTRLEEGRLELRKQAVEIPSIASRVLENLGDLAANHAMRTDFPAAFPVVLADSDKVEQVLTNLVENALKYTEKGEIVVNGTAETGRIKIAVSDQGGGIPPDQRLQVFEKFFRRGDPTTGVPTSPGSGLGLYISRGLVEAHGGAIWVEDAVGSGGSVFAFTLPL